MRIVFHLVKGPRDIDEYAPLGFGYLAAFLAECGIEAKCTVEDDLQSILSIDPDVIGLQCTSQNYGLAIERARLFRERCRAKIILGGAHISCLPDSLDPAFHCGVVGEGEDTFQHLVYLLREGAELTAKELAEVPGVVFWDGPRLVQTGERVPLDPLDSVPPPDRSLLAEPALIHLHTSRGCSHACSFCSSHAMWGHYRAFSAARVAEELADLIKQGYERIHIHDDLFVANRERLVRLLDILEERELLGAAQLSCTVRADLVDDYLAELLVGLHVSEVTLGLESADAATQKRLNKGFAPPVVRHALAVLDRFGIECSVSAIVGEPDETMESMRDTFAFLTERVVAGQLNGAEVNVLAPFPGSRYWALARQRGLIGPLADFDWSRLGAPWRGLLLNPHLEREAGRLVAWDRHLRALIVALHRPLIVVSPDQREFTAEVAPTLMRAVFLLADEPGLTEVMEEGEVDLVRFGPENLLSQLKQTVEGYGEMPLLLFAPDLNDVTAASVRAAKLALIGGRRMTRTRLGKFPLAVVAADALAWGDDRVLALVNGDENALPTSIPVAEPAELRCLPHADLNQPVPYEGSVADFLDGYTATLGRGPHQ